MPDFAGQKISPICDDDKQYALAEQLWITGIAFESDARRLFLKCAFRKGHIQTVILDPPRTSELLSYLESLLKESPGSVVRGVSLPVDASGKSIGHWFPPKEDQT